MHRYARCLAPAIARSQRHVLQRRVRGRRRFFSFGDASALTKSHSETKVVPFSAEEMYDVVADVDRYQEFLPFCADSRVLRRPNANVMEAMLKIGFHVFTESYTSRVIMNRPNKIVVKSIESPTFKRIESEWVFHSLPTPNTCKIDFKVTFEVASFLHANAIQLFFDDVAVTQLNAFIARAGKLYGTGARRVAPCTKDSTPAVPACAIEPTVASLPDPPADECASLMQVAKIIKDNIGSQQLAEMVAIYDKYARADGRLDFSGFSAACTELGNKHDELREISENSALAGAIFSSFETSGDAKDWLDKEEFAVGIYLMTQGTVEEKALSLFHAIDTSRDGKISREELTTAMQRRIHTVKKIFPKLVKDQVQQQMQHENLTALPSTADDAMAKGLEAIESLMEDIEKEIPLAVNQIFLEADLDQDDFITEDEWLFAWQAHPEFVELMTIDGMRKVAQWASVVQPDPTKEAAERDALESRLTYVD
ncbi:TPA: hypothetical protein N0F65_012049 [Lagenidium giganteum]|uniref:EF-hand domain-containing protein n=1 Tax=Lagenidium giganteum TaxID=4803 RepID=A0AAV2YRU4_9STRA|nr:TPA: hypothetical protein N0F65_012049 [Lagenidium giganteum]